MTRPERATTRRARSGFTLLEILMSAFVIALGTLGLLALFAGAASQQQASADLTTSVTLSKNAESQIKTKVKGFGTSAALGCLTPVFEPDVWYALPADERRGFLTINPTNDPASDALYFEEDQRNPVEIYRAGAPGGFVRTGVASVDGVVRAPYNTGPTPLSLTLEDRRLLLRGSDRALQVRFFLREIDCGAENRILFTESGGRDGIIFEFNGDCRDAENNVVYLGRDGNNPATAMRPREETHVRINTESFPVDGRNPARLVSFLLREVEQLDSRATWFINTLDGSQDGPFPECADAEEEDEVNYQRISWLDNDSSGGATPLYEVFDLASASHISIPDPRGGTDSGVVGVPAVGIENINNSTNRDMFMQVGSRVPAGERVPTGPFVVERPAFVSALAADTYLMNNSPKFYSTTPPTAGAVPAGWLRPLRYASKFVERIEIEYKRRADELVSLNDRVRYARDARYPGGERPDMTYSVLYRDRGGRASDQFVIFTYALAPQRSDAVWFPPETGQEIEQGDAPLRRARGLFLRYNRFLDRWELILGAGDENINWIARPGQLLLFGGRSRADGAIAGPGAETVVRVTSVEEAANGSVFLILDAPPRAGGANLLRRHYPLGVDQGEFDVWGIQNEVRSAVDNSLWGLDPIEARVFQAGGGS